MPSRAVLSDWSLGPSLVRHDGGLVPTFLMSLGRCVVVVVVIGVVVGRSARSCRCSVLSRSWFGAEEEGCRRKRSGERSWEEVVLVEEVVLWFPFGRVLLLF